MPLGLGEQRYRVGAEFGAPDGQERRSDLAAEVGDGQAEHVAEALASLGYADITVTPDLSEQDRVVEGRR